MKKGNGLGKYSSKALEGIKDFVNTEKETLYTTMEGLGVGTAIVGGKYVGAGNPYGYLAMGIGLGTYIIGRRLGKKVRSTEYSKA